MTSLENTISPLVPLHEDQKKSKTKCMTFFRNTRKNVPLRKMMLDDKPLPWVKTLSFSNEDQKKSKTKCMTFFRKKKEVPLRKMTHLGVTNNKLFRGQDTMEKRAQYVAKCNELRQKFHFPDPNTVAFLNDMYNTHFYGATLWDLFSNESERIVGTWNARHRIVYSLPRTAHRYLVESISQRPHIIRSLWKRFLKFSRSINCSRKPVLRNLFHQIRYECRTVTGRNLWLIMLKTNHDVYNKSDLQFDWKMPHYTMSAEETWRVPVIEELLDTKNGKRPMRNFVP